MLVPGHAFVGFYTDADAQHAAYLETTLLGVRVGTPRQQPDYVDEMTLTPSLRESLASYDAALRAGTVRHARVAAMLDGQHRLDYTVIDIATARAFGIRPIAIPAASVVATGR